MSIICDCSKISQLIKNRHSLKDFQECLFDFFAFVNKKQPKRAALINCSFHQCRFHQRKKSLLQHDDGGDGDGDGGDDLNLCFCS